MDDGLANESGLRLLLCTGMTPSGGSVPEIIPDAREIPLAGRIPKAAAVAAKARRRVTNSRYVDMTDTRTATIAVGYVAMTDTRIATIAVVVAAAAKAPPRPGDNAERISATGLTGRRVYVGETQHRRWRRWRLQLPKRGSLRSVVGGV